MSDFAIERTSDGSYTLRDLNLDQACHSSAGAWLEARERYAEPCRIRERVRSATTLRVLDVGTGPAWNVAALLEAASGAEARLELVSLELSRRVFELGAECVARDESGGGVWLGRAREVLARSAESGGQRAAWNSATPAGTARLLFGDAREELAKLDASERFDVVFLDPFSPASAPDLWQHEFLGEIAARMNVGALLSTYTTSLAVRASLASAGLRVGAGPRVGEKHQGTLASRDVELEPLDPRTQRKLARRVDRLSGSGSASSAF